MLYTLQARTGLELLGWLELILGVQGKCQCSVCSKGVRLKTVDASIESDPARRTA